MEEKMEFGSVNLPLKSVNFQPLATYFALLKSKFFLFKNLI